MAIKCCKDCVPPTRYPGCHAKCEQYKTEKTEHEKQKEYARACKDQAYIIYSSDFEMLACMHRPRKRRN